jgi:hypothetical protein
VKITKNLFFIITFISLFWFLITLLPIKLDEFNRVVQKNRLIDNIETIYNSGIPHLLFIPISFISLIFAISDTHRVYKQKPVKTKRLIFCLFLVFCSLCITILNIWAHNDIVKEIFAG